MTPREFARTVFKSQDMGVIEPIQSKDVMGFILAIEMRLYELAAKHQEVHQQPIVIPDGVRSAAAIWRTVQKRFSEGDERWSANEFIAICEFADWTVEHMCVLKGIPIRKVAWGEGYDGNLHEL